jgi:hypothetical protein
MCCKIAEINKHTTNNIAPIPLSFFKGLWIQEKRPKRESAVHEGSGFAFQALSLYN